MQMHIIMGCLLLKAAFLHSQLHSCTDDAGDQTSARCLDDDLGRGWRVKAEFGCKAGKSPMNLVCSQTLRDLWSVYSFPRVKSLKDKLNIYSALTYSPFTTPAPPLISLL